ncbi:MAG TPA: hypothetical protein VFV33_00595, partial [Gemmatimonadaceae bacterium]|nr:hypothetical protein [Gemmatimonadaceae bacterium]
VAADVVAAALMGFDPARIPVIRHACAPHPLPITRLGQAFDGLEVFVDGVRLPTWRALPNHRFRPHPGWVGKIERELDGTELAPTEMRAESGR